MKRAILALLTLLAVSATGCHSLRHDACGHGGCHSCGTKSRHALKGHYGGGGHFAGDGHYAGPGGSHPNAYYAARRPGHPDFIPKLPHHYGQMVESGPPGPPAPSYAYPYYTTRGPRDFLLDNPPSIGR